MVTRSLFDEFNDMRRSFDQLFENFFSTTPARRLSDGSTQWSFTPVLDTGWTDEHLNLRLVIPGVQEKDLKVTVQGNQLYVQGERRAPENFGKEGYIWSQIPYGKFERVIDLPSGLDVDKLQAYLHDGFLDIRIPLATEMKPKQIPVSAGKAPKELAA